MQAALVIFPPFSTENENCKSTTAFSRPFIFTAFVLDEHDGVNNLWRNAS